MESEALRKVMARDMHDTNSDPKPKPAHNSPYHVLLPFPFPQVSESGCITIYYFLSLFSTHPKQNKTTPTPSTRILQSHTEWVTCTTLTRTSLRKTKSHFFCVRFCSVHHHLLLLHLPAPCLLYPAPLTLLTKT